jgi:leader peptidase (prepilin peptidase)/N-methyltransferase
MPLLAAPFIGSLAGVLIRRLPAHRSVVLARSECEICGHHLSAIDLIPILSFVALRGRCRLCHAPIPRFHIAVELAAVSIAAMTIYVDRSVSRVWIDCGLGWTLMTLAWIDAQHQILPDILTLPLLVAGLCVTAAYCPSAITSHALGAIAGYAAFRAIEIAYRKLRGRDGLGQGDAKLLAASGAWLGLTYLPLMLVLSSTLGIITTLSLNVVNKQSLNSRVPFGPALAASFFIIRLSS